MRLEPLFTGVCTALITPFAGGKIDWTAFDRLLERQLEAGVAAVLPCGTTGEPSTMSEAEWRAVIARTVRRTAGRALVIAGTGSNNLRMTAGRARAAEALGADAHLVVTPYYNKTTQEGLVAYFLQAAEACRLPMLLYNVPPRTGLNLLPATAAHLAAHPRVAGVKEAGGDLNQIAALLRMTPLPVYCGSDELTAPAAQLGACGVISVLSNLLPRTATQLFACARRGCLSTANALQQTLSPLIEALFSETSPAPVKTALAMMGLCGEEVRLPLIRVQRKTRERLREQLARFEVLPG